MIINIFKLIKRKMKRIYDKLELKYIYFSDNASGEKIRRYYKERYGIEIGKYTYGYTVETIASGTKIGAFCSIAPGVKIGLMNHPMEYVSTNPFLYYKNRKFIKEDKKIAQANSPIIEDDVWIGVDAVILPGVTIHKGAIIGANAVVTKDVPRYAIAVGVPAKVIGYRFDEKIRGKLQEIDWCNWKDEKIRDEIELFYEPEKFIEAYEREIDK